MKKYPLNCTEGRFTFLSCEMKLSTTFSDLFIDCLTTRVLWEHKKYNMWLSDLKSL